MEEVDTLEKQPILHVPEQNNEKEELKGKIISLVYYCLALLHCYLFLLVLDEPLRDTGKENVKLFCLIISMTTVSAILWPLIDVILIFFSFISLLPHKHS